MTVFREWLNGPSKNAEDSRVLMVGIVCTLLIFTVFSA